MNKRNITPIPSKNNTPNLPDGKNWREFLGKKHIDVGSRIRDDEQGKMHQEHYVKDLFKPSIDYPISEEEWEEIWKGNGVLRDSIIKDILFHPECINTQSTDEQSRRECLGTKYLEIRNGKVRDPRNPNIWHLISEEDRIEIETVNKVYDLHEERISDQQLHEAGMKNYLTNSLSLGYLRSNYREQVFTALQEENLTLHAIPEFLEEQKQPPTLPVPLFTGIAKKEKVDHYEKSILDFFKKYEHHSLENLYIRDREIIDTEHAFVKGHIDKGKLLQRTYTFQAIQQRNFIQFYKRMYRYGREYGSR